MSSETLPKSIYLPGESVPTEFLDHSRNEHLQAALIQASGRMLGTHYNNEVDMLKTFDTGQDTTDNLQLFNTIINNSNGLFHWKAYLDLLKQRPDQESGSASILGADCTDVRHFIRSLNRVNPNRSYYFWQGGYALECNKYGRENCPKLKINYKEYLGGLHISDLQFAHMNLEYASLDPMHYILFCIPPQTALARSTLTNNYTVTYGELLFVERWLREKTYLGIPADKRPQKPNITFIGGLDFNPGFIAKADQFISRMRKKF